MSLLINNEELKKQSDELKSNLDYYNELGKPLVDEYAKELDTKVTQIRGYLDQVQEYHLDFDVPSLQKMCVDLSTTIYWTSSRLEELGLLEDMSKIRYKDKYNEAYLAKQGTSTVADKKFTVEQLKNHAEGEALSENLINFIYSHATSALEAKIDNATELLKVISKCLSAAIAEVSAFNVGGKYQK